MLRVSLLGRFGAEVDGRAVSDGAWSRRDASALVKLLVLHPGRRLHRERVMDLMWPALAAGEAAPRLHKAAHYARRALGSPDALVLRDETVALAPGTPVSVDVEEFEGAATAALATGSPEAASAVIDRFPGELLPADRFAEWAAEPRERLATLRRSLLRQARRWRELIASDPVHAQGSRQLWDAFNELQRTTSSAENAAAVLETTAHIDAVAAATQVQAPTLVLHARHDQRPPFEQGRLTASLIRGSRFVALDSPNHILLPDEPAWPVFLREVEGFLSD